jgi:EAL domain-containing protein (putative c-di-GMP-specific phosphodiesterase class I)
MDQTAVGTATLGAESPIESGWCLVGCLARSRDLSRFPVDQETYIVGRRPGVHLQIPSARVSGRHAELLVIGHCLFIRDLGSTNGTYVNRRRIRQPTPLAAGDHIEIADVEFRIELDGVRSKSSLHPTLRITSQDMESIEDDWVLSQLDRLIRERAVAPFFQPIVRLKDAGIMGYESLARSKMCGMENPALMFDSARMANREVELSLVCRQRAIEVAQQMFCRFPIFVNTHPNESFDLDVMPSVRTLREASPEVPMVVEIHEAAVHDAQAVREFRAELRALDVMLAYDDFGAGRSRLMELAQSPPDFLKFDASLIRNVHQADAQHLKLLRALIEMAREFDTQTLAEGTETAEEVEACRDLGFELAQGYFFGRPAEATTLLDAAVMIGAPDGQ